MKLVRETSKKTKLCFSSIIKDRYQRTDIKDIDEKIKEVDSHFENYCKKQNLGYISKSNINKSDLAPKGLHLKDCGNRKLAKNFLEYAY